LIIRKGIRFSVIIFLLFMGACSKTHTISQAEAEKIAADSLKEYANQNKFSVSEFGKPQVRFSEKDAGEKVIKVWEIYYSSKNKPVHQVNVLVNQYGAVEIHHLIDK